MSIENSLFPSPEGISFDLPDLVLLRAWADYHDIQMSIDLDYCAGGEEFEEVVTFRGHRGPLRLWIMWRTRQGLIVQPLIGKPMLFASTTEAMDVLSPTHVGLREETP